MSLLDSMADECRIMNRIREDDPYGSYTDTWSEGALFSATIIKNGSPEMVVAEKQGVSEDFIVVVQKGFPLEYHDVFKRISDGQIFRVTSNTKDSEAPEASTIKIAKVSAEKWVIPNA